MSDDWKTATGETATPTTVEVGDMVIKISTGWMFLKTGGVNTCSKPKYWYWS